MSDPHASDMSNAPGASGNAFVAITRSVEETVAIGVLIGRSLRAGDVVLLEGVLGAGKTQLVRGIAVGMGHDGKAVSSPTFVFMQEYGGDDVGTTAGKRGCVLVHMDAYRLSGPGELESVGFSNELLEASALVVEWPSRIESALPMSPVSLEVALDHVDEATRRVEVSLRGGWGERLSALKEWHDARA